MDGRQKDQAIRDEALTRYSSGVPSGKVCADLGIHRDTLRKWARTAGLEVQVPVSKFTRSEKTRAEALRLYVERPDLKLDQIGRVVGVHFQTVRRWVNAAGLPRRGRGCPGQARRPYRPRKVHHG